MKMFDKNKLFLIIMLLLLIVSGIIFKSNIDFQITATFGIKVSPKAQPEIKPTSYKAGITLPNEASLEGTTLAHLTAGY